MQALYGLVPFVAFFVTYIVRGLYAATAVLMVAMLLLLAIEWFRTRHVSRVHLLSAVLVWGLGGATLLLHNRLFIQWKPTVLYWALSAAFLVSFRIGERNLTQRLLQPALDARLEVSAASWRRVNLASSLFCLLLGALNLVMAYYASERAWVYFKVFGLALLTFVFLALQMLWLSTRGGVLRAEPTP
jgi:intracellular septation protein